MTTCFCSQRLLNRIAIVAVAASGLLGIAASAAAFDGQSGPRVLAPGVMQSIPSDAKASETVSRHDLVELLGACEIYEMSDPNAPVFDMAKNIDFRRDVWALDFKFKPVRMIWVDLPDNEGKLKKTLIWYMVYSVTNPGEAKHPVPDTQTSYTVGELNGKSTTYDVETTDVPVRFIPHFVLASVELNKAYPDRVIPAAMEPIAQREDRNRTFLNSQSISETEIQPGETVWGVATWEAIDPHVDEFSIYVTGLTNAYRWTDTVKDFQPNDPVAKGRVMSRKVLKLNFWRPGDEYYEKEDEIRYGRPGMPDYEWLYMTTPK